MTTNEHQRVIEELQALIDDTQQTLRRFETISMDEQICQASDAI